MTLGGHRVFDISFAAVAAPLLAELPIGRRVPIVISKIGSQAYGMNPEIAQALIAGALVSRVSAPAPSAGSG
jgi:hypothetical protein